MPHSAVRLTSLSPSPSRVFLVCCNLLLLEWFSLSLKASGFLREASRATGRKAAPSTPPPPLLLLPVSHCLLPSPCSNTACNYLICLFVYCLSSLLECEQEQGPCLSSSMWRCQHLAQCQSDRRSIKEWTNDFTEVSQKASVIVNIIIPLYRSRHQGSVTCPRKWCSLAWTSDAGL